MPPPILLRHLEINDGALLTLYRVSADTDNMGWRRNKNLAATCFCALDDALPDLVTGYYCASRPLKVFQFKCSWIFDSFFSRGPTFFFLIVVDVLPTSLHERHQPKIRMSWYSLLPLRTSPPICEPHRRTVERDHLFCVIKPHLVAKQPANKARGACDYFFVCSFNARL